MSLQSALQAINAVRAVRFQRLRGKTTVNHMNTKTTQLTNEIAENTRLDLEKVTRQISKMIEKNPETPIHELQSIFKVHVGTIIAESVRNSYLLGFKFIEEFAGHTIRITPQHLFQIDNQIERVISSYWNNIQKILEEQKQKKYTVILGAAGEETLLSKLIGFLNTLAVSSAFASLGQGTISARVQQFNEDALAGRFTTNVPRLTDPLLNTRPEFNPPFSTELRQPIRPLFVWVSERDGRVCPQCTNLDGRTFDGNDPDMPTPGPEELGGSTHWGCRCRTLPLDGERAYNA